MGRREGDRENKCCVALGMRAHIARISTQAVTNCSDINHKMGIWAKSLLNWNQKILRFMVNKNKHWVGYCFLKVYIDCTSEQSAHLSYSLSYEERFDISPHLRYERSDGIFGFQSHWVTNGWWEEDFGAAGHALGLFLRFGMSNWHMDISLQGADLGENEGVLNSSLLRFVVENFL